MALGSTPALQGSWLGVAKASWDTTPLLAAFPTVAPPLVPLCPLLSLPAKVLPSLSWVRWTQAWDAFLILPNPIFLGLGKLCSRVPVACGLPPLPSPPLPPLPSALSEASCSGLPAGWWVVSWAVEGKGVLGSAPSILPEILGTFGEATALLRASCSVRNAHNSS